MLFFKPYSLCLLLSTTLFLLPQSGFSKDTSNKIEEIFNEGIIVDLKNPQFENNILSTTEGGVVTNDNMRIQAREISYTRKKDANPPIFTLEAQGDLTFEYNGRLFIGKRLEYDFLKKRGTIYDARTDIDDWYLGGETISLFPDGSFETKQAFVTTCGDGNRDWQIKASSVHISDKKILLAKHLQLRFLGLPFFWLPQYESHLDTAFDAPLHLKFHWGGGQGPRIGLRNKLYTDEHWKTFYRVDYRTQRGISGGVEGTYENKEAKRTFNTKNTLAYDTSLLDDEKRARFEMFGLYEEKFDDDHYALRVQYDRLSDAEVVTDYYDKSFNVLSTKRTEASISRLEDNWKASLISRLRINNFETTLQQLPTLYLNLRPQNIGSTNFLMTNDFSIGYLDYVFADNSLDNYYSTRIKSNQTISYPIDYSKWSLTPYAGFQAAYYDNGYQNKTTFQPVGIGGIKGNTHLTKTYDSYRHRITPYFDYTSFITSNNKFERHYIFGIQDAQVRLNQVRLGVGQTWTYKSKDSYTQKIETDLYTYGFFGQTSAFPQTFPKSYLTCRYLPREDLSLSSSGAWNHYSNEIDYINAEVGYTHSENTATSLEYRHRSKYDWKKSQKDNFMLEAYQDLDTLLSSLTPENRDTYLAKLFLRPQPGFTTNLQARYGNGRDGEPSFFEWKAEISTILRCTWLVNFSYVNSEAEDRWGVSFELLDRKPKRRHIPNPNKWRSL
jgi:hypothetical protein